MIFQLYQDNFDEIDVMFSNKKPSEIPDCDREDSEMEELAKERHDWILAIDTFNKYFIKLLSNPAVGNSLRTDETKEIFRKIPSYDLIIQKFIAKFIVKHCLPILNDKDFLDKLYTQGIGGFMDYDYQSTLQN